MQTSWIRSAIAVPILGLPLEAAGTTHMPLSSFTQLMENERRHRPTADAWRSGEAMQLESLSQLGQAIGNSRNLGEALKTFAHGFPLLQSNTSVELSIMDHEAHVSYRVLDPHIWPRRADAELSLGLIRGICARFGISRDAVLGVSFEHEPDGATRDLVQHLGVAPAFGRDENRLRLAVSALSNRPVVARHDDYTASWRQLEQALRRQRSDTDLSARVYSHILQRIGHGPASQADTADALGISERSLRRGLAAQGSSFSEIMENCRRMQGYALLTRSDRPLSEIALLLGYSDQTAFSRAFARWYGVPPRELRRSGALEESVIR
ncbi:MAG: AraC family transcriptional regulator ligand-binding domain-containing protein [Paracoccus sp. (in: a-proteobacteria)]|uniref:AraC-like transcriptional regulator QhpR n=1 Tax=Paracoccus sp. TaxID=267 RepID=UPI0026DF5722|nr:AraC family transcriptional regulator [Paracoccus sp. (in: a-proteobacteria)]MDO5620012.1 AraC family transcriptional regulator ligand-binding domain-containing protein [Paracoccus sp. (in: a-proteobacteria)]